MNAKHNLIAKPLLCAMTATDAKADGYAVHWSVHHPNGALLVADTKAPMKAGALALVAEGYATAADTVALALEEQGRWTTSEPVTVAEASA
ncbi:hypothetical protein FAZ78_15185 [Cereibacter changlensis]|uniref:Uncharacterized protein n=1 Tax=Cereibacter changlensis TaxID=402884 RepID=A0A4U0YT00_9RHOB|nr:hypothetical protein [Cereibacter changlensis]TKA95760.1 hypothetical protein FAZ78_15185 [Cereibacter changlensis]